MTQPHEAAGVVGDLRTVERFNSVERAGNEEKIFTLTKTLFFMFLQAWARSVTLLFSPTVADRRGTSLPKLRKVVSSRRAQTSSRRAHQMARQVSLLDSAQ